MINFICNKLGKIFISKKNMSIFFIVIFFLITFLSFKNFSKYLKLKNSLLKINSFEKIAINSLDERKKVKNFIDEKISYDKFFIDNNLENLSFLQNEKSQLVNLKKYIAFLNGDRINARLDFINSEKNKLKFAEENTKTSSLIKETLESQLYSIEVDENDLQKLLTIIEETPNSRFTKKANAPQLLITNFNLSKENCNSFTLDMKILKREFFKKK